MNTPSLSSQSSRDHTNLRSCLAALFLVTLTTTAPSQITSVWMNETNAPGEADYAVLQFPATFSVPVGLSPSPTIYGRIYEGGLTEAAGANSAILAEVGWGASASDPRLTSWTWTPANFNIQVGNDDEYQASFLTPALAGTYSFTYRFSLDNGLTWTLADLTGAGSGPGLNFDPSDLGSFSVLSGAAIPEPARFGLFLGAIVLGVVVVRRVRAARPDLKT